MGRRRKPPGEGYLEEKTKAAEVKSIEIDRKYAIVEEEEEAPDEQSVTFFKAPSPSAAVALSLQDRGRRLKSGGVGRESASQTA